MRFAVIMIVLLAPPAVLPAQSRWMRITGSPVTYLDTASVAVRQGNITGWVKAIPSPSDTTAEGRHYAFELQHIAVRCDQQQLTFISTTSYSGQAELVSSFSSQSPAWRDATPDSAAKSVLETTCIWARAKGLVAP